MAKLTPEQSIEAEEAERTAETPTHRAGHIERAYDERDSQLIGGVSVAGIVIAGGLGATLGLFVMLFVNVDLWWAGVLSGALVGAVVGGLVPARFALQGLERETRPPGETTTASGKTAQRR